MKELQKFDPVMTIGTVAKKLGICVQTLHLYESEGLILPSRTDTGRRMFSQHDLNRLICIREMIKTKGLNLQGIKRLMSLIPCWEFKGGLDEECQNCPAYSEALSPCWSLPNVGSKCHSQNCRECIVYQTEFNCNKMKEIIYHNRVSKL